MAATSSVQVFCFAVLVLTCSGSKIDFTSSPSVVALGLTRSLTLQCSLTDTTATSSADNSIIGRRSAGDLDPHHGSSAARRDLTTETHYNVNHVTSVVISKLGEKNKTVATITSKTPATATTTSAQMQVQGHADSRPGERAHLEVTWSNPSLEQDGFYQCEVSAIDPTGRSVSYVQLLEVGTTSVSLDDLATRLVEIQNTYDKQISQLMQADALKDKTIATLESENQQMQAKLSTLESKELSNDKLFAKLNSTLSSLRLPHSENGRVACGHSDAWTTTGVSFAVDPTKVYPTGRATVQHVVFKRPYMALPSVIISPATVSIDRARYNLDILNLTPYGFDVRCSIWESGTDIYHFDVLWMSTVASNDQLNG